MDIKKIRIIVDILLVLSILVTAAYFLHRYYLAPRWEIKAQASRSEEVLSMWQKEGASAASDGAADADGTAGAATIGSDGTGQNAADDLGVEEPGPEQAPAETSPAAPRDPFDAGSVIALLRVPNWGSWYAAVIVDGVEERHLRYGIGHFPFSAGAGEIGNFALAAHRTPTGGLFHNMDKLAIGDLVLVETRSHIYTYEIYTTLETVDASKIDEVAPVPHEMSATATEALITLQGCRLGQRTDRVVLHGRLIGQASKVPEDQPDDQALEEQPETETEPGVEVEPEAGATAGADATTPASDATTPTPDAGAGAGADAGAGAEETLPPADTPPGEEAQPDTSPPATVESPTAPPAPTS